MNKDKLDFKCFSFSLNAENFIADSSITISGETYTAIPAIMLKHGVFVASYASNPEGHATYYPSEALKASIPSWNGRSVSIGHPSDGMTMNTPSNFSNGIGFLFDTSYDEKLDALKATVAVHNTRGEDIISRFVAGENIDVSTGVWGMMNNEGGEYNGIRYDESYSSIIGDHLAILPGGKGACSFETGCGLRVNIANVSNQEDGGTEAETAVDKLLNKQFDVEIGKKNMDKKENCTAEAVVADEKKPLSLEEVLDAASDEVKILLNDALVKREEAIAIAKAHREDVIAKINAFNGVSFCPKFLETYDIGTVEKINELIDIVVKSKDALKNNESSSVDLKVDYSLNASKVVDDNGTYPIKAIPVK